MTTLQGVQARVIAGAVLISFSGVFVKLAQMGPTGVAFYRSLIGAAVLIGLALARRQGLIPGRAAFWTALAAAFFFSLDLTLWHTSINFVGPGLATILTNFQVFFTGAIGILFLGERLSWRLVLAVPLAIIGLMMLAGPGWQDLGPDYRWGVGYGLAAALAYTGFILFLRRTRTVEPRLGALSNMALVSILSAGILGLEVPALNETFIIPDAQTLVVLIALGVISQVLGWLWISDGLPRMAISRGGLILLLQPTLSMIWDFLFFARPFGLIDSAGACLALGAIYLGLTGKKL